MTGLKAYTRFKIFRSMLSSSGFLRSFSVTALLFLASLSLTGQNEPEYDEISVFLEVKGVGGLEIPAVIKGEELYLPVTDLFEFLRIRNIPSPGLDSISGFFINPEAKYYINRITNRIIYQERLNELKPGDLIRTETNLYLRSVYFGKIFGLECAFNFRNLSVSVTSKLELPLIKEMKQEEMRRNLTRLKGEIKADTSIGRTYPGFRFGMADWSAIGTEEINGKSETRLNLTLGSVIAGGETTVSLNYNSMDPLTENQQLYLWRYVNNDFKPVRQILAGKITTQATSSLYNPVIGVQLTNTPTTFRRSFGTYTLSDNTEPGWIVELYVNNVLVDYTKSDASGFFTFQVPLVYGNTIVKLKFYGPWGEEKTKEQNISIPFNFLPEKTLEYTVSAGLVEDTLWSKFSRAVVNYGLTRGITIGGGVEYLSSVSSGPLMPFVKASFRIAKNLLLNTEYTYGVRALGTLSYRLPSNLQFELNYTLYNKNQKAIFYNYREERKASVSLPLRIGKFSSFNRFTVNQLILPLSKYTSGEWLFSGSLWGINTNLTTYGLFTGNSKPYFYSNLYISARLPGRFVIMPQIQYGYTQNKVITAKLRIEKPFLEHAFLNASFERNFMNNLNMAELGFRYDFSFARTGVTVRQSGNRTSFIENASGSLINDRRTRFTIADNRTNVGRGGITILPFIDMNANGKRDAGEQKAPGLNVRVSSGRVINMEKDTTLRIVGLEPYASCFIELDPNSFESIAWQLPFHTMSVIVDPDMLKTIEVPVIVAGEANGTVTIEENGTKHGQGRVIVDFFNEKMKPAGRTLTEDDGYYSLFGLHPGKYTVMVDTVQLRKLGMTSEPDSVTFSIKTGIEGEIIDNLNFNLKSTRKLTEEVIQPKPVIKKDTVYMIVHEVVEELITITEDSYAIQLGAFKRRSNAEAMQKKLEKILGKKVDIVVADNFYKVRINDIKTRAEVDKKIEVLRQHGITELWVISLKAKQQQWMLREKKDSIATIMDRIDTTLARTELPPVMSIQIGAFRSNAYAVALKNKVASLISNPVEIILEEGYYKVRITGFTNKIDLERILPSLGMMGLRDIWVPPVKTPEKKVVAPVVVPADTARSKVEVPVPVMKKEPEVKPAEKPKEKAAEIPPVSIWVGEFIKKSQANRAQRKIKSKLDLDSEIAERWGYYYIVIGGFYTREETYRYYPELAGIGYTKISVIVK